MIKIKLGGFPFYLPQRWQEVSQEQAKRLFETDSNQLHERLTILGDIPPADKLKINPDIILAIYPIISFIEDVPELVPDKLEPIDLANDWTFAEFETARQFILKHINELGVSMIKLAEIKELESNYIEAGAKILDAFYSFMEIWEVFDLDQSEDDEPSATEEAAGIHRLEAFGPYAILESIAKKFGKLPREIENEPVGFVMQEYHYQKETNRFNLNLAKLQK